MKWILMLALAVIPAIVGSCEKEDNLVPYGECIKGTVFGFEECSKGTLIKLDNISIGNSVIFHDIIKGDTSYTNVIKSPGIYPKGMIYFIARKYNSDKDYSLFLENPPNPCVNLYGPYEVPIIVIVEYSQTICPK